MNTYFWNDTETTGTDPKKNQMLTMAFVVKNFFGKEVDRLELKFKLIPNREVSQKALETNKIDPYSPEWNNGALTYEEGTKEVAAFVKKHKSHGTNYFLAFKALFDWGFMEDMLGEQLFNELFNSVVDTYTIAKKAVSAEMVKTPEKESQYNPKEKYRSCTLQDVAKVLGTVSNEGAAHSALPDVLTMIPTTELIYKMLHGVEFYTNPSFLNEYKVQKKKAYVKKDSNQPSLIKKEDKVK